MTYLYYIVHGSFPKLNKLLTYYKLKSETELKIEDCKYFLIDLNFN